MHLHTPTCMCNINVTYKYTYYNVLHCAMLLRVRVDAAVCNYIPYSAYPFTAGKPQPHSDSHRHSQTSIQTYIHSQCSKVHTHSLTRTLTYTHFTHYCIVIAYCVFVVCNLPTQSIKRHACSKGSDSEGVGPDPL